MGRSMSGKSLDGFIPKSSVAFELNQLDEAGMISKISNTPGHKDHLSFKIRDIRHSKVDHDGGGRGNIRAECAVVACWSESGFELYRTCPTTIVSSSL